MTHTTQCMWHRHARCVAIFGPRRLLLFFCGSRQRKMGYLEHGSSWALLFGAPGQRLGSARTAPGSAGQRRARGGGVLFHTEMAAIAASPGSSTDGPQQTGRTPQGRPHGKVVCGWPEVVSLRMAGGRLLTDGPVVKKNGGRLRMARGCLRMARRSSTDGRKEKEDPTGGPHRETPREDPTPVVVC